MTQINDSLINLTVIFDNGGGVTLQADNFDYGCVYDDGRLCAADVAMLLAGGSVAGWEGSDDDATLFSPSDDDIANGGYRIYDEADIRATIESGVIDTSWANINDFFVSLGCKACE